MPILGRSDPIQQVPLEAVYMVIECKSILNKAALKDAEGKFAKIRTLPRCPSKTRLKKGMSRGPGYILFGYRLKTSVQSCLDFMGPYKSKKDVAVVALNSGCGVWIGRRNKPIWFHGTVTDQNVYETLAFLYVTLLQNLQNTDLGEPNFIEMLLLGDSTFRTLS